MFLVTMFDLEIPPTVAAFELLQRCFASPWVEHWREMHPTRAFPAVGGGDGPHETIPMGDSKSDGEFGWGGTFVTREHKCLKRRLRWNGNPFVEHKGKCRHKQTRSYAI